MKLHTYILIALFLLPLSACKTPNADMSDVFLNHVKGGEYDKAKSLLNSGVERTFGKEGLDFRLNIAHELLIKYGIPSEDKWQIKYDTAQEKDIFRMIIITIPVCKAKEPIANGDLEYGEIELDYIYKMPFFEGSIFSFDTHIKKKHVGSY